MRKTFVRVLQDIAETDPRVLLLTGDLGFMALEPFAERFPNRFYNVGVAEQNMVGVATGLADAGFIPFVYSIVTFATLRPYEFIRNGPILHGLPVRVVGIGGGYEYGDAGPTHHGLEDVAIFRAHPGMRVLAPADSSQAETIIRSTWALPGPTYYRLGKDDRREVRGLGGRFEIDKVQTVRKGSDLCILAMGSIASEVAELGEELSAHGVQATVGVVASINPAPHEHLTEIVRKFGVVLTVEAHYVNGGLGSLVSEAIAESGAASRLVRCGVRMSPDGVGGNERYMWMRNGLTKEQLLKTALQALALSQSVD